MKRLIKMTLTALVLLALSSINPIAAFAENGRARLLNNPNIESLYAIDDNFTMISLKDSQAAEADPAVVSEFSNGSTKYRIIRHNAAEPFVYRNSAVPSYQDIGMLPDGRFDLAVAGYSGADLYEHLWAVCRKTNGSARFVIPVKYGQLKRLTQVSAVDAFNYIVASKGGRSSWFMACDGGSRFVAEKEYSFKSNTETAVIRSNRGLEGVSYIKSGEEVAALAAYEARSMSAKSESTVLEETAIEAAALKADFIKVHNGVRYSALYKAESAGCGTIEVKKMASSERETIARVYDYRVCGYNASLTGERAVTPDSTANRYALSLIEPMR